MVGEAADGEEGVRRARSLRPDVVLMDIRMPRARRARGDPPPGRARRGRLPPRHQARIPQEGIHRVVCDYLAGMTDRFALDEHRKLFDPLVRV